MATKPTRTTTRTTTSTTATSTRKNCAQQTAAAATSASATQEGKIGINTISLKAIQIWNDTKGKAIVLLHITC